MIRGVKGIGRRARSRAGRLAVGTLLAASGLAVVGTGVTWVDNTAGAAMATKSENCMAPSMSMPKNSPIIVQGPEGWPSRTVVLKKGSFLEVHLCEAAGSTGYSWSAVSVPKLLVAKGDKVRQLPGDPMPGKPSDHVFLYQVVKLGDGKMTFELRRPQMPASSPGERTLTLNIKVRD